MGSLPLAESRLCALVLEGILYGFYVITFVCAEQVLLFSHFKPKPASELNIPVVSGTICLFFMISGHFALGFYRGFRAFIFSPFLDGAFLEYTHVPGWLNVTETAFILFGTVVGNWILVHRCWVLWNKSWRWVLAPCILWIGCFFCTIRIIILETSFKGEGVFNSKEIMPYGTSFWAASILINISTTVLTVLRIWLIEEANKRLGLHINESNEFPKSTLHYIICITVETGLAYTLTAIATFVTYVTQNNSVYIMISIELSAIGMACDLIILRAHRRHKRILRQRQTLDVESNLFRGVVDTVPFTAGSIEPTTPAEPKNLEAATSGTSRPSGKIEEIPYP
ncbi:hypothetical protein P691DRAFT_762801 [Macrolepiota fuliginosa MF-IS2]|uniref:Uncharacterized protein n=1 Tax=Macrolepiota fuliginosa MF-IS2 TaxID=1400762 RepID=A0A9P5X848_9AGAR|nr:hypothetical protein P691DRAFT_676925 [Macrolepiota fuliginosa MF-IS2]KAF9445091.1 hypothetical protein P691DRAFT_762801 [Macrolepiota fuliginosa MF-IS2]